MDCRDEAGWLFNIMFYYKTSLVTQMHNVNARACYIVLHYVT